MENESCWKFVWDCIEGRKNIFWTSVLPICGHCICLCLIRVFFVWLVMPFNKGWLLLSSRFFTFLNRFIPEYLISFVAFVSEKKVSFFFPFCFPKFNQFTNHNALFADIHTQSKCALSLGIQMETQHTCKAELIGWKWISIFELNFNYTSNTWIYFPWNEIKALQIKKSTDLPHPTSTSRPFPRSEVVALRRLLFTQNLSLWLLKHIFYSLCVCVCLHTGGIALILVCPASLPVQQQAAGSHNWLHHVWFPCFLMIDD